MALNQLSEPSEPKFITVTNAAQQSCPSTGPKRNLIKYESKQRRPYLVHSTTARKGCGLQDLCEDDRAKLARLIYELAATQQALSDLQRTQSDSHAVSPIAHNIFTTALGELSPRRSILHSRNLNNSSGSNHKCSSLPSDEGTSYRSRLTCLETELQEIRSLLTKQANAADNGSPHVEVRAPTRTSTPNELALTHHQKELVSTGNSETPTCARAVAHPRDTTAKSVETSDASVAVVSVVDPTKLRDASVSANPPDDQQPREKLSFERDTLRRQQRVLSVIAKQQVQLQQLTGQLQVITASMFAPKTHQAEDSSGPWNSVAPLHTEDTPLSNASQKVQLTSAIAPASTNLSAATATFQPTTGVEFRNQTTPAACRCNSKAARVHGTLRKKVSTVRSLKTTGVQTAVAVTRGSETQALSPTPSLNRQLSSENMKLAKSAEADIPLEVVVDTGYHARQPASAELVSGAEFVRAAQSTSSSEKDRTQLNLDLDDIQKVLTLIEEIHSINPMASPNNHTAFWPSTNKSKHRTWDCRYGQSLCTPHPILDPAEEQLLSDLFFTDG